MKNFIIPLLVFVFVILPACQTPSPSNTSVTTPPDLQTVQTQITPTKNIDPTSTPKPPTLTPTPIIKPPEILLKYLNGIEINNALNFDSVPTNINYNPDFVKIMNGEMEMKGEGYQGGMELQSRIEEGEGVMFDMKIVPEVPPSKFEFETFFDNGTWWTDAYRRFGMYLVSSPESDLWMGKVGTGKYLSGNLVIKPDVQYRVALAVGENADFLGLIWNPEKPESFRFFHQPMGEKWFNNEWLFVINGASGKMIVDNLMTFSFDGFQK